MTGTWFDSPRLPIYLFIFLNGCAFCFTSFIQERVEQVDGQFGPKKFECPMTSSFLFLSTWFDFNSFFFLSLSETDNGSITSESRWRIGQTVGTDDKTDVTYRWRDSHWRALPAFVTGLIQFPLFFVWANCCQSNLFPARKSCFRHHIIPIFGDGASRSDESRQLAMAGGRDSSTESGLNWQTRLVHCLKHNTFCAAFGGGRGGEEGGGAGIDWGRGVGWKMASCVYVFRHLIPYSFCSCFSPSASD